jgi:hypothetical protein
MQAITLTAPPHSGHVLMSILNTRFNRWAQVIDAWRSAGVWSCVSSGALVLCLIRRFGLFTFAALCVRHLRTMCAVRGKHTVEAGEVNLGLGTKAASLAMKSKGFGIY